MSFLDSLIILGLLQVITACGNNTKFVASESKREIKSERGPQGEGDLIKGEIGPKEADATPIAPDEVVVETLVVEEPVVEQTKQAEQIERLFISAPQKSTKLSFNQEYLELKHELKRVRGFVEQKDSFTQLDRPKASKTFTQGTLGKLVTEEFDQNDLGIIDILAVVDNSGSMKEEQIKVSKQLPELIKEVSGANWQIRVVSTDARKKCSQYPVIKKANNNNPASEFENTVLGLGINGSGDERGVFKAHGGIKCVEDPWIRNGSNLVVLLVSDEDNCSNGDCASNNNANDNPSTLINLMGSKIGDTTRVVGQDARAYGIFWVPNTACPGAAARANVYQQLVADTSGVSGSICDNNYTSTFKKISQDMKKQLKSTFKLANLPEGNSLVVTANDVPLALNVDYTLSGDTLEFINVPAASAKIKAVYRYDSVPKFKEVALDSDPGLVELVKITLPNGDMSELGADKYSVAGKVITFKDEPADNAVIMVAYRENVALKTEFPIDPSAKDGTIKVKIDQVDQGYSYQDKSGILILDVAPLDSKTIEVSYEIPYVGDVINKIDAKVDPSDISNLSAFNETSSQDVEVKIVDGSFVLPEGLSEGDKIKLRYRLFGSDDSLAYELPFEPIDGSITVSLVDSDGVLSDCSKDSIDVEGQKVHLDCNIEKLDMLTLGFEYNLSGSQDFRTSVINPDQGVWTVYVNGVETTDYVRSGDVVSLKNLAASSEVRILHVNGQQEDKVQ